MNVGATPTKEAPTAANPPVSGQDEQFAGLMAYAKSGE